jgi:hypothetical protein
MPILGLFTHGLVPSSINRPGVHNINQAADARAPGRAHDATMNQHHAITFPAGVVASFTFSGIDVNSARKVFVLGR